MDQDRERLWKLLEPEHRKLVGFCRRLAGDRDRGDDLCQEAILAALRRFDTLREPASFKAWLYRIVLNRYRNTRRGGAWKWLVFTESTDVDGAGSDPAPHLEARRALDVALRALSAEDRALVTLSELEGWCLSDLSALTGRSENTLKVRLFRIRMRMRDELSRTVARRERRALRNARRERVWIAVKPSVD
jgi:RNA polymerase sigma-70 factor (ECF subfamily)